MTKWTKKDLSDNFSDFYKDVFGSRPSQDVREDFDALDLKSMEKEYDRMAAMMKENEELEQQMQSQAAKDFDATVAMTLELGAKNRAQAIEWLMDAEDLFSRLSHSDGEFFCWLNNLPFSYAKEFDSIISNKVKRMRGV